MDPERPFSETGCKGTLFSFTSKSFSRNFSKIRIMKISAASKTDARQYSEVTEADEITVHAHPLDIRACTRINFGIACHITYNI